MLDDTLIDVVQGHSIAVVVEIYLNQRFRIASNAAENVLDDVGLLPVRCRSLVQDSEINFLEEDFELAFQL